MSAIGPSRYQLHYPFADLARTGALLAMGSDWPVFTPAPWAAISAAANRTEPGTDDPLLPDQSLSLAACLPLTPTGQPGSTGGSLADCE